MLATLDRTDDLLLLCGLDVPTIKNVRLSLQTLELLSFLQRRVGVVLNRANTNVGIQRAEVERALETKIRADLPSDRAVPLGVNRGKPVALNDPGADFSKAIAELAKGLMADTNKKKSKRAGKKSLLSRMRSVVESPIASTARSSSPPSKTGRRARRLAAREVQAGTRTKQADPYAELKTRVHHACIARQLSSSRSETTNSLEEQVMRTVMEQLALDRTPLTASAQARSSPSIAERHPRLPGPLEPFSVTTP